MYYSNVEINVIKKALKVPFHYLANLTLGVCIPLAFEWHS